MITGESRPVAKGPGDRVVAGTVSTDSSIRVRVDAVGDDTALAGIQRLVADAQASAAAGPRRSPTASPRCCSTSPPAPRVVTFVGVGAAGRHRRRGRADRHRAGDRLPARPRAGDPAGDRAVDRGRGAQRHPGQGPPRAGADAHDRRRAVRQDRHAHQGRARRHRRRRRRRSPRTRCCASPAASRPTASTRSPGRSSPPRRNAATWRTRRSSGRSPGRGVEADIDGTALRRRRPGPAPRAQRRRSPAELQAHVDEWTRRGAAVLYLAAGRRRRSARSRSRTRSAPRRARPSPSCSDSASASS